MLHMHWKFNNCCPPSFQAENLVFQCYFNTVFLQKSYTFSLQTLTNFEAAKTRSGVGFLHLTTVNRRRHLALMVELQVKSVFEPVVKTLAFQFQQATKRCESRQNEITTKGNLSPSWEMQMVFSHDKVITNIGNTLDIFRPSE